MLHSLVTIFQAVDGAARNERYDFAGFRSELQRSQDFAAIAADFLQENV